MTPKTLFLRLLAYIIDIIAINILWLGFLSTIPRLINFNFLPRSFFEPISFIVIAFLYFFLLEKFHYTIGQFLMGIMVVSKDHNENIAWSRAFVRGIFKASVVFLLISIIFGFFTKGKQTLHDFWANTKVVIRKSYYNSQQQI
jgi:uncharacterized RDD family membrane protein YckC